MDLFDCMPHFADDDDTTEALNEMKVKLKELKLLFWLVVITYPS